jgi:hypothetical protein
MKTYTVLLILAFMAITYLGQSQTNELTIPLSDPAKRGKLKAHLNSGSITVKGTARKDVLVKYSVSESEDGDEDEREEENENNNKNQSQSAPPKTGLKKIGGGGIDLQITENENSVRVESGSWNQPLELEIEVPSGFDLQLHTYNNGDLMISNIQGALELTNYNGEITALNISGSAIANTYNGAIRITFDKVTPDTPMSYSTFNGDVDITFPAAQKASFKLKTEQGDIYSDFDLKLSTTGPVKKSESQGGVYKVVVDEWRTGTINGGGAEFTMRNYTGDIVIRKK